MGRILVIRGGAVGDFILTLPAIQLIRENLPDNEIEILGYPSIISLAIATGLAERTRSIEHGALSAFFIPNGVLDPDWIAYFADFDLVVSYLYDPDGHFHANLEKCGPGSVLTCSHRVTEPGDHAAIQLARPLEKIALYLDDPIPSLTWPKSDTANSDRNGNKRIAIHPGSGGKHKIWPVENWVEIAHSLAASHPDHGLVLITGEAEQERGITGYMRSALSTITHTHLDSLPLTELAVELTHCALFLGHDSGISHLAAACEVPSILLFGPTDPAVWAPKNPAVQVIKSQTGDLRTLPIAPVLTALKSSLK